MLNPTFQESDCPAELRRGRPVQSGRRFNFNAVSKQSSQFGYGWSNSLKQWVAAPLRRPHVTKGERSILVYSNKDGSGQYRPPGGVATSLVRNADGTETQPDGFQLRYQALTKLLQSPGFQHDQATNPQPQPVLPGLLRHEWQPSTIERK